MKLHSNFCFAKKGFKYCNVICLMFSDHFLITDLIHREGLLKVSGWKTTSSQFKAGIQSFPLSHCENHVRTKVNMFPHGRQLLTRTYVGEIAQIDDTSPSALQYRPSWLVGQHGSTYHVSIQQ